MLAQACDLRPSAAGPVAALPSRCGAKRCPLPASACSSARRPPRGGGIVPEAEQWAHEVRCRIRDRCPAGELVAVQRVRRRRRLRPAPWWSPEGWDWLEASSAARRAMWSRWPAACWCAARAGCSGCRARSRCCTSAGTRPRPGAAGPAGACPARPNGNPRPVRAQSRGFAWGDTVEWVAGRAAPYPGFSAGPARLDPLPEGGRCAPAARRLMGRQQPAAPSQGAPLCGAGERRQFCGFRSCAI